MEFTDESGKKYKLVEQDKVVSNKTNKEENTFWKKLLSDSDNVSSKRFMGVIILFIAIASYIIDAFGYIDIDTQMGIAIFVGGSGLLASTVFEKKYKPTKYDTPDNPTIAN